MVEAEYLIGRLRNQVLDLQKLLQYLESREQVEREDFPLLHAKLREVIKQLKQTERYSSQRQSLPAIWLN